MPSITDLLHKLTAERGGTPKLKINPCGNPTCRNVSLGEISKYQRCPACRSTRYCSASCQKKHWKSGHKAECQDISASIAAGGNLRQKALGELDALVELLCAFGSNAAHLEQVFEMASQVASASDSPFCLMFRFSDVREARAWRVLKPQPVKIEAVTLDQLRASGVRNPAEVQMEKFLVEHSKPSQVILYFDIKHPAGLVSRMVVVPDGSNAISVGDLVELSPVARMACIQAGCELDASATVVSIQQQQRTCVLRFACGAEHAVWCCWVRPVNPRATCAAGEPAASIITLDDSLQGRAARADYKKTITEMYLAATGSKMKDAMPDTYSKLRAYEQVGTPFEPFGVQLHDTMHLVPCFLDGRFSADLQEERKDV